MAKTAIAVIGGTGKLGSGLALRWARAGHAVLIGSRDAARAAEAAAEIGNGARGLANAEAAAAGEVVAVTVPFASQAEILTDIRGGVAGKIVVDTTVPLMPPKVARVQLPATGSAALAAQALLGEKARVVSAFHNVAAHKLSLDGPIDCDVLVFGDAPADREVAVGLAEAAGLRGVHGGPLANSAAAEALTSVLIGINKRYKANGAGVRITGIDG
ncbi:MAG: NADPH-dependent F420 reductase [Hyphomicrobiales bacterium]|nr:NADPH-dependent F420 reductase [Hyphomicrobiales bacterium]